MKPTVIVEVKNIQPENGRSVAVYAEGIDEPFGVVEPGAMRDVRVGGTEGRVYIDVVETEEAPTFQPAPENPAE